MARVPYSGVNQVDPTGQGTGQLQEQRIGGVSAAAFGGGGSTAAAEALAGFGDTLEKASVQQLEYQKKVLTQTSEVSFRDFVNQTNGQVLEMEQSAPANGIGHTDGVTKAIIPAMDKWLASQPAWLQREYAPRMTAFFGQQLSQAQRYELGVQRQFSQTNIQRVAIEGANTANAKPDQADAAIASGETFIQNAVGLTATEIDAQKLALQQTIRAAELKARAKQQPWLTQKGGAEQLRARESGGNYGSVNQFGFAGAYQFGAPRLAELGVFQPAGSLDGWNQQKGRAEKWAGTFNIPGFPEVRTVQDFLNSKPAQDAVYALHEQRMDATIDERGWGRLIGQTVNGVQITREGLRYGMHLGGPGGVEAFLRGETRQDANGTKVADYIAMGRYGAGTIADDPKFSVLAPDQRDALVRDGEREFRQQQLEAENASKVVYNQRYDNLWKDINSGKAGSADIQTAMETWLTDPKDINQLQVELGQARKKIIDLGEATTALRNDVKVWDPQDSDDKKRLNLLLGADNGVQRLSQMDNAYTTDFMRLVERTRMAPPDAVGTLRGMARSVNPTRMNWAMSMMDQIERTAPNSLPDDMQKDMMKWRSLHGYFKDEDIVEKLRKDREPAEVMRRKEQADLLRSDSKSPLRQISDSSILNHFDPGMFSWGPAAPLGTQAGQLRAEFDDLFTELFMDNGGNAEAARDNALTLLERKWGSSEIGGTRRLMKFPAEKLLAPAFGGDVGAVRAQAAEGARVLGVPEGTPFALVADTNTEAEVSQGVRPTYKVFYFNDLDIPVTPPGRIQFDPRQVQVQRELERARTLEGFNRPYTEQLQRQREQAERFPWERRE